MIAFVHSLHEAYQIKTLSHHFAGFYSYNLYTSLNKSLWSFFIFVYHHLWHWRWL